MRRSEVIPSRQPQMTPAVADSVPTTRTLCNPRCAGLRLGGESPRRAKNASIALPKSLPRRHARLVSLGTGRLGTHSAEAAAARGLRARRVGDDLPVRRRRERREAERDADRVVDQVARLDHHDVVDQPCGMCGRRRIARRCGRENCGWENATDGIRTRDPWWGLDFKSNALTARPRLHLELRTRAGARSR